MSYDTWKCTAPTDEDPDLEACGHRVGTCEGECMVEEDEMASKLAMMLEMIRAQLGPAAEGYLVEALRRDWAVRVLDAHATSLGGPDPALARLAAAQAVYPTLPADARSRLGECP